MFMLARKEIQTLCNGHVTYKKIQFLLSNYPSNQKLNIGHAILIHDFNVLCVLSDVRLRLILMLRKTPGGPVMRCVNAFKLHSRNHVFKYLVLPLVMCSCKLLLCCHCVASEFVLFAV